MANLSDQASAERMFHFRSKGGAYTAIWMGDKGDLYQEYSGSGSTAVFYPNITPSNPITMKLTVASGKTSGTVTPAAVTYYANETELVFNTSGACTTTGMTDIFKLVADGNLQIIGNLAKVANFAGYMLKAKIRMSATAGTDEFYAYAPVNTAPYSDKNGAHVTIAAPDGKNFTITTKGGSCKLKALTTKGGQEIAASGLTYEWYKLVAATWTKDTTRTTQEITVTESEVDTYAKFKVIVKQAGAEIGHDVQSVMDASDPYDIVTSVKIFNGTGSPVASTTDELLDDMPDSAYLEYTCNMVVRGSTTPVSGTKTYTFVVVAGNGAMLFSPTAQNISGNVCKVTVGDLKAWGAGLGDYQLLITAKLS